MWVWPGFILFCAELATGSCEHSNQRAICRCIVSIRTASLNNQLKSGVLKAVNVNITVFYEVTSFGFVFMAMKYLVS
jgi:hypothetical protein